MSADYDRLFGRTEGNDGADRPDDSTAEASYDVSQVPPEAPRAAAYPESNGHVRPPMPIEPPHPSASSPQHSRHARPEPSNSAEPQHHTGAQRVTDRIAVARADSTRTAFTGGADKQVAKPVPRRGWRRRLYKMTRINPGLSRDEKHETELRSRIVSRSPRGSYQIGVLGLKGGAGKTALTVALGSLLAQVRGDRILVIDADPASGNLADRVGRDSGSSIVDLVVADRLAHYNDIRLHTSVNAVNLEVLAAEDYSSARHTLSEAEWHRTAEAVSRFYNLVLTDCGGGLPVPAMRALLSTMSAVVIVATASVDAARQAAITLDWLQRNGFDDLGNRACVVITQLVPGMPDTAVRELAKRFERRVQPGRIVVLPWDEHIACGTEIQLDLLDEAYARRILELAAVLSDDFDQVVAR